MARVVLGVGTSHTPQMSSPPELWHDHVARDAANPCLVGPGGEIYKFDELPTDVDNSLLTLSTWRAVIERSDRAINRLHDALVEAAPDVVLIVGDDQNEMFLNDGVPVVAIYWGETIQDLPPSEEQLEAIPAGIRAAHWAIHADKEDTYPVASGLGRHLIECLVLDEFDVSQFCEQPRGRGVGHAFTFVRRRVIREPMIPVVPVLLNTYNPPNQPTPRRCYLIGRALRRAIESYPEDLRVAVVASGGLSHFVIDEALDRRVLDGLATSDVDRLTTIPREVLRSGASEILNWIAIGGCVEGMSMEIFDYIAAYRSRQGTGVGMAFCVWR